MFGQNEESAGPGVDTLVGPNTSIKGDLRFSGGLHIDGRVEGSVAADGKGVVVVSDQGSVQGEVTVSEVIVDGRVEGDIVASERVELRERAQVTGTIRYGSIRMALGAQVNGRLVYEGPTRSAPGGSARVGTSSASR